MKTKLIFSGIVFLVLLLLYLIMPWKFWEKNFKHAMSDRYGLNRIVYELDCNRKITKTWKGKIKIEETSSGITFILEGKEFKVSPPYRVEEID